MLSMVIAVALRLDFDHAAMARFLYDDSWFYPGVALTVVAVFAAMGDYRKVWRYASIPDLLSVVAGMSVALGLWQLVVVFGGGRLFPRTSLVVAWFIAVAFCGGMRILMRLASERTRGVVRRALIVGANDSGEAVLRDLRRKSRTRVVGFVDDHKVRIRGVNVLGSVGQLRELVEAQAVDLVILAQPSPALAQKAVEQLAGSQMEIRVAPGLTDLTEASLLREVRIEDLLAREPIKLDMDGVAAYLGGRTVLVTGAGGSIGSEICRQVSKFSPRLLILLGRGENSIYEISLELRDHKIACFIADVRDQARMKTLFEEYSPEVVFHAAAHKHVPLMEANPSEAVTNNVFGTLQLMEMARSHGVQKFILLSSDKAVNPSSVMGATKRLCELLLVRTGAPGFVAVRFGNVLGSRGSVIPTFRKQILRGGPVTVTDPEMARYFMTIPEAVGLVLQCSVQGNGGEIFVLDMGQPIKIVELARQMITLSGYRVGEDIEIKFTGLKPGEKLFEELQHHTEKHQPTPHPRIMRFVAENHAKPCRDLEELVPGLYAMENSAVKQLLKELVVEYTPHLD